MYIPQKQLNNLKNLIAPGKVVVIYGARRVGKTTLLNKYIEDKGAAETLFVNGDGYSLTAWYSIRYSVDESDVSVVETAGVILP